MKNGIPIEHVLIIAVVISITTFGLWALSEQNVQAQVEPTDRFFSKDFCASEITLLDGINYQNGDELSYDSSGCPVSNKVIHRWNELSAGQQSLITARLSASGYVDVTNVTTQVGQQNGH